MADVCEAGPEDGGSTLRGCLLLGGALHPLMSTRLHDGYNPAPIATGGAVALPGGGSRSLLLTASPSETCRSAHEARLQGEKGGQANAEACKNDFEAFDLSRDFELSFDADVSGSDMGCNIAVQFVDARAAVEAGDPGPHGDYFCDASAGYTQCGACADGRCAHSQSFCTEIGAFEANRYGVRSSARFCARRFTASSECPLLHGPRGSGCDGDAPAIGSGFRPLSPLRSGTSGVVARPRVSDASFDERTGSWQLDEREAVDWSLYGPGLYIDSQRPYRVRVQGKWTSTQGGETCEHARGGNSPDCRLGMTLELEQDGRVIAGGLAGVRGTASPDEMALAITRWQDRACSPRFDEGSSFWLDACRDADRDYQTCWTPQQTGDFDANPACEGRPARGCLSASTIANLSFRHTTSRPQETASSFNPAPERHRRTEPLDVSKLEPKRCVERDGQRFCLYRWPQKTGDGIARFCEERDAHWWASGSGGELGLGLVVTPPAPPRGSIFDAEGDEDDTASAGSAGECRLATTAGPEAGALPERNVPCNSHDFVCVSALHHHGTT